MKLTTQILEMVLSTELQIKPFEINHIQKNLHAIVNIVQNCNNKNSLQNKKCSK